MNGEKFCELKCKYNIVGKCNRYGTCIAKDLFISEFEKLKAEINVNAHGEYDFEGYCREEKISIKEVNKIIDNHISELKERVKNDR